MTTVEFIENILNWDKKSKGMFDYNGLEGVLSKYQTELKKEHESNVRIRVHGYELNEAKFEELARPMIKYLCENHHPHVTVIITPTSAELLEGLKSLGSIDDYIL